jgi:UDP-3-O-[3-hydroxymyristoyl] N-acetylglucosamine deacetylase
VRMGNGQSWIEVRPPVARGALMSYQLDYGPHGPIGRQTYELLLTPDAFRDQLAPCRTFMLQEECEALLAQGLGGRATARDLLVFGPHGPVDNQLRFHDECVRHKLLDMVGDLGLAGCDLIGRFTAHRSGHRHNAELVRTLLARAQLCAGWRCCA